MKIELVKEYDKRGKVSYYVKAGGKRIEESTRYTLVDAMEAYEEEKRLLTRARVEVLIREEV